MTADLVLPRYGAGALSDVLPSIGAHLGVPGCTHDPLGLPSSRRWVVVLVDGLGWHGLMRTLQHAPYLGSLLEDPITVGAPSTTATSITSLGTGLEPGQHGVAGYRYLAPEVGVVFSPLPWDVGVPAAQMQPRPTVFERIRRTGLAATAVTPARFIDSGLTEAALRGTDMPGVATEDDYETRLRLVLEGAAKGPGVVYAYERKLDHAGHGSGVGSREFCERLETVDAWCEKMREQLPDDVRMVITGDHGMIDVPESQRLVYEDHPQLAVGVEALGGEGRFRHVYTEAGQAEAVADRWRDVLGETAWVRTRDEAVAEGWFGEMAPEHRRRFGDVVAAMRGDHAVMTRALMGEWNLIGMHGSLTADEMLVPLLVD